MQREIFFLKMYIIINEYSKTKSWIGYQEGNKKNNNIHTNIHASGQRLEGTWVR